MAKIVANNGVTVELSGREVELVREALAYSVRNNLGWDDEDDRQANDLECVLSGTGE
jgi:hypothetical protein